MVLLAIRYLLEGYVRVYQRPKYYVRVYRIALWTNVNLIEKEREREYLKRVMILFINTTLLAHGSENLVLMDGFEHK